MRGPVAVVVLLGVATVLGGCVNTSSVSDALTGGALEQRKKGVAILRAQVLGHGCSGGSVTLGKKLSADVYSTVATIQTSAKSATTGNDVMQVELPPDEYHVINVACSVQSGRRYTSVSLGLKEDTNALGFGGTYKKSFATFHVKSGEIVNIGALTVMSGVVGGAQLSVTDLPADSLKRFKMERPNLATQMVKRLMIVHRPQLPPAERAKMCDQIRELAAVVPSLAGQLPPDCQSASAPKAAATVQ